MEVNWCLRWTVKTRRVSCLLFFSKEDIKKSKDTNINKSNAKEDSQNNEEQDLLDIKNDYVFKRTFGYKGDEEVTKVLLRDILGMKVNEIDLDVNPITEKELMDDKLGIMDIASVVNDNVQVDIEMQVVNKNNIEKRIMYYWNAYYQKSISKGDDYEELKRTIIILIADFEIKGIEQAKKYFTEWEIREKDYSELILTDVLKIRIIELPKYIKYKVNNPNLNLWTEFLENPEVINMSERDIENEKDESIKTTKKAIKQAKDTLEQISKDKHEQELARLRKKYIMDQNAIQEYEYCQGVEDGKRDGVEIGKRGGIEIGKRDGIEIGKRDGIEIGKNDGIQFEKIETAKKMLAKKMPIDVIIEITGLSKEEIEKVEKA